MKKNQCFAIDSKDCKRPEATNAPKWSQAEVKKFSEAIQQQYHSQWLLDDLPAGTFQKDAKDAPQRLKQLGFPLGCRVPTDGSKRPKDPSGDAYCEQKIIDSLTKPISNTVLYNHLAITAYYNQPDAKEDKYFVVRFEVKPYSVDWAAMGKTPKVMSDCEMLTSTTKTPIPLGLKNQNMDITWSYSVNWVEEPNVRWRDRWDVYIKGSQQNMHWFAIINSVLVLLFLTVMVASILYSTVLRDLERYRVATLDDGETEDTGWKLVHGDVFRPPQHPMLLSVALGTGAQILGVATIVMLFALLGLVGPIHPGSVVTSAIIVFVLLGAVAGYVSARFYKYFTQGKGGHGFRNMIYTACAFPALLGGLMLLMSFALLGDHSTVSLFSSPHPIIRLFLWWLLLDVPLVFVGSLLGFRMDPYSNPVRTNVLLRQIPEQLWYLKPWVSIPMGGVLPFGTLVVELIFVAKSIWQQELYFVVGFMTAVFLILLITCSELSLVLCYFQLSTEDYHWWWRSFLSGGACGGFVFIFSIGYFLAYIWPIITPTYGFATTSIFFTYSFISSLIIFLLCGTVAFLSCFLFVRRLYAAAKVL